MRNISKNIKIGITAKSDKSLYTNGIAQNVLTLFNLIKSSGYDATLVSEAKGGYGESLGGHTVEPIKEDNILRFDLIIEVANSLSVQLSKFYKFNKKKIIVIEYGNNFLINSAKSVYKVGSNSFFENFTDEVWISPHFSHSLTALRALRKVDVKVCPYIWVPTDIVDDKDIYFNDSWNSKSVGVFESNLYFVKMCHIPMLICENYYNNFSKELDAYIFSSKKLEGGGFTEFANMHSMVSDGKMSFENRYRLNYVLNRRLVGTIISHQLYNELNYLQLEAMYLGIPFIHNSKTFENYGYYYPEMDVDIGAKMLDKAINTHKENYEINRKKDLDKIFDYSPKNKKNINGYIDLLESFIQRHF